CIWFILSMQSPWWMVVNVPPIGHREGPLLFTRWRVFGGFIGLVWPAGDVQEDGAHDGERDQVGNAHVSSQGVTRRVRHSGVVWPRVWMLCVSSSASMGTRAVIVGGLNVLSRSSVRSRSSATECHSPQRGCRL